jgi:predicted DsbA family dithiol-disulfide isomerase
LKAGLGRAIMSGSFLTGKPRPVGEELHFHMAVYKAYFVDLRNIGDVGELVHIAQSAGLPGNDAEKVLDTGSCKEAVDSDWALSRELGVTAVLTYLIDGDAVVGAYPYDVLEDFLKAHHVGRRT